MGKFPNIKKHHPPDLGWRLGGGNVVKKNCPEGIFQTTLWGKKWSTKSVTVSSPYNVKSCVWVSVKMSWLKLFQVRTANVPHCPWKATVSPIIMVQCKMFFFWKVTILLEIHPFLTSMIMGGSVPSQKEKEHPSKHHCLTRASCDTLPKTNSEFSPENGWGKNSFPLEKSLSGEVFDFGDVTLEGCISTSCVVFLDNWHRLKRPKREASETKNPRARRFCFQKKDGYTSNFFRSLSSWNVKHPP